MINTTEPNGMDFSLLLGITKQRLAMSPKLQGLSAQEFSKFLEADGQSLSELLVQTVENRFQSHTNCYRIPVNYDEPDAIVKAIRANGFPSERIHMSLEQVPLGGREKSCSRLWN